MFSNEPVHILRYGCSTLPISAYECCPLAFSNEPVHILRYGCSTLHILGYGCCPLVFSNEAEVYTLLPLWVLGYVGSPPLSELQPGLLLLL